MNKYSSEHACSWANCLPRWNFCPVYLCSINVSEENSRKISHEIFDVDESRVNIVKIVWVSNLLRLMPNSSVESRQRYNTD